MALDTRPQSAATHLLASRITGSLLDPSDPHYEDARKVRNGLIDRHPALIAMCETANDVAEAVNYARESGLIVSIRAGGHGVAGNAVNDDGIVIDISRMNGVVVDPARRRANVQGGATWADLDAATQQHGLAAPGGVVSSTGVAGLTLHGGLGHLRRKHGLSLDNVRSLDVVTADGELRHASPDDNPDLYWALLGAGSNFGVVTSFEFELHPVGPEIALCAVLYPQAMARDVLLAFRDFGNEAPDDVAMIALQWSIPDHEAFPEELRHTPVALIAGVHIGPDPEAGLREMDPLRHLGEPVLDLSAIEHFTELQQGFDPFFPKGKLYYWKSTYLDTLSDEAIDVLVARGNTRASPDSAVTLWQLGGAIARGDQDATSFGRRDAPYLLAAESSWTNPADNDANIAWSRDTLAAAGPFSHGGLYINFPGFGEDRASMVIAAFGAKAERLLAIKERYDPANLFRMNLNLRRDG